MELKKPDYTFFLYEMANIAYGFSRKMVFIAVELSSQL